MARPAGASSTANCSIHLLGDLLFAYVEDHGDDPDAGLARMAEDEATRAR